MTLEREDVEGPNRSPKRQKTEHMSLPPSPEPQRKKRAANRLVVDEPTIDDNSVVSLQPDTMELLSLFAGDAVLIKGKKRRDTVCTALADPTCDLTKIRVNRVARSHELHGLLINLVTYDSGVVTDYRPVEQVPSNSALN